MDSPTSQYERHENAMYKCEHTQNNPKDKQIIALAKLVGTERANSERVL